jgi:hypothetical protein
MSRGDRVGINVKPETRRKAKAAKRDGETWDEYLLRCTDAEPEIREFVAVDDVVDELERIVDERHD